MNTETSSFMRPEGGPKTAFELYLESKSPLPFGEWKLTPAQKEHVQQYFGEKRRPVQTQLLRHAA